MVNVNNQNSFELLIFYILIKLLLLIGISGKHHLLMENALVINNKESLPLCNS